MTYNSLLIDLCRAIETPAPAHAKQGQSVSLVEKPDHTYGENCINAGCIPSKILIPRSDEAALHRGAVQAEGQLRTTAPEALALRKTYEFLKACVCAHTGKNLGSFALRVMVYPRSKMTEAFGCLSAL